jgi:hypothetical protein
MTQRSLREFSGVSPTWVQFQAAKRQYELRVGDAVAATLRWENAWGSLATGETAEGQWTLKRAGFLRPRVTVRVAGSDPDVAVLLLGWGGSGDVRLADGRQFLWAPTSFWHSEWAFTTSGGEPLLVFKPKFALMRSETEIEIKAQALSLPELSLLAILGWYLMVLINEEVAAAEIP